MGLSGISVWELLIVLLVIIVLFGSKRFGDIGADLGTALRNFQKALGDGSNTAPSVAPEPPADKQKPSAN